MIHDAEEARYVRAAFRLWEFYRLQTMPCDDVGITQSRDVSWTMRALREFVAEERLLETMY